MALSRSTAGRLICLARTLRGSSGDRLDFAGTLCVLTGDRLDRLLKQKNIVLFKFNYFFGLQMGRGGRQIFADRIK